MGSNDARYTGTSKLGRLVLPATELSTEPTPSEFEKAPRTHEVNVPDDLRREIKLGEIAIGAVPTLTLVIVENLQSSIQIKVEDDIILGRGYAGQEASRVRPTIDLAPYSAARHGVSRSHARITYTDKLLRIQDLNSTNGTFLNGLQLQPYNQRLLRDGDQLQLGNLQIRVYIA